VRKDFTPEDELLFLALGGSGEIGMNVNLYGCRGQWLMVDLGMTFGGDEYPGIDLVFADLEFIEERRDDLIGKLEESLGGSVRCVGTGPMETKVIGIVTGGAGGEIYVASREGIDTYITGEAPHWAAVAAEELGINLFLGGHYATETFGVKALAAELSAQFEVPWEFLDHPTGL